MPALAVTYRRKLHEHALENYGFITTRDAAELGVPPVEVRKLTARGGLTHVARGLYRFDDIPYTGREEFMEAVLRAGDGAFLTGESVLALHDLAQVNPRVITVGSPRHVRADLPPTVEAHERTINPGDLTIYEGIPSTTIARALLDCRRTVMHARLEAAIERAAERGLLRRSEQARVRKAIGAGA